MQQPQTAAEHADDISAATSSADSEDSGRSSLEVTDDEEGAMADTELLDGRRRASTHSSIASATLTSVRSYSLFL